MASRTKRASIIFRTVILAMTVPRCGMISTSCAWERAMNASRTGCGDPP
jgi:hypothetical protein